MPELTADPCTSIEAARGATRGCAAHRRGTDGVELCGPRARDRRRARRAGRGARRRAALASRCWCAIRRSTSRCYYGVLAAGGVAVPLNAQERASVLGAADRALRRAALRARRADTSGMGGAVAPRPRRPAVVRDRVATLDDARRRSCARARREPGARRRGAAPPNPARSRAASSTPRARRAAPRA